MSLNKIILAGCFLIFTNISYAAVDSRAYIIEQPKSNMNNFAQGFELGQRMKNAQLERAETQKIQEREDAYRLELKEFHDKPETINRANLTKLMFKYPERNSEITVIIDSLDKSGLLKD